MDNIQISIDDIFQELRDKAQLDLILAMIPENKDKKLIEEYLKIFIRHGVSIDKAVAIMTDLNKLLDR